MRNLTPAAEIEMGWMRSKQTGQLARVLVLPILAASMLAAACADGDGDGGDATLRASLRLKPDASVVQKGERITVEVQVRDAKGAQRPAAFQFILDYDEKILRAVELQEGPYVGEMGPSTFCLTNAINEEEGIAALACASTGDTDKPKGSGTIAVIEFEALEPGTSVLKLEKVVLASALGAEIVTEVGGGKVEVRE